MFHHTLHASFSLALFVATSQCLAQSYPVKPLRVLISSAPGGPVNIALRGMTEGLRQDFGQPVIIENQGAADGIVAAQTFARTTPDGYPGFRLSGMGVLTAPKGTPDEVISTAHRGLEKIINDKSYQDALLTMGLTIDSAGTQETIRAGVGAARILEAGI